jgi:ATPase subunit of ABC transporter with duplicated ATPase domains
MEFTQTTFVDDRERSSAIDAMEKSGDRAEADAIPEIGIDELERLEAVLAHHVVDLKPGSEGVAAKLATLGSPAYGVIDGECNRPNPQLRTERIALQKGTLVAIVGPNGAGKSTLFDALMERLGADFKIENTNGAVIVGEPVHARESLRVARLDQEELLGGINTLTAGDVLDYTADYFKDQLEIDDDAWSDDLGYERNLANQGAHQRIEMLMEQITKLFDMGEFMDTQVAFLSGGERTKLALFMTLLSEPDLLLLDEPTNHLDLGSIAKLSELLTQYSKVGVSVACISHVGWFLEDTGKDGTIEVAWNRLEGYRTATQSSQSYKSYARAGRGESARPVISGEITWPGAGLYHYRRGQQVIDCPPKFSVPDSPLSSITIPSVSGGDRVLITGANGSGKTTLLNSIIASDRLDAPSRVNGAQAAYLPQFWPESVSRGTIRDLFDWVKLTASPRSEGSAKYSNQPPENLFVEQAKSLNFGGSGQFGESWLKRPLASLSGGEQRVLWFLAVGSLPDVDILVLDEPTNHLDPASQRYVTNAIKSFPGAVVVSTHDPNLMLALGDKAEAASGRAPTHLHFDKSGGVSSVEIVKESQVDYVTRVRQEARSQASRLKIDL